MRRFLFIAALFVCIAGAAAQEGVPQDAVKKKGGFGAPVLKYTSIRGRAALMFGGRGGWILNESLVLGGGGYALASEVDAGVVDPWVGPLNVDFSYWGFEIEYIFNPRAPFHFSVSALAGGGATRYLKDTGGSGKDQHGETGFMWVLEPGVNAEVNVLDWLHLSAGISYRATAGLRLEGFKSKEFAGLAATLAFKLGRF